MTVSAEPSGKLISWNAAKNEPPLSVLNEKKFLKFSQNAQVTPSVLPAIISKFATPIGIANSVAIIIPIITAPLTLK